MVTHSHIEPVPRVPSDLELLGAWRSGNLDAGACLFERHYPAVDRFFRNRVHGREREDLIQATFLGCLESMPRFRGESSFRTLLFAIAHFKLLKHLRVCSRDQKYRAVRDADEPPDEGPGALELVAADKQRRILLRCLRGLPLDTQLMLELHYWEAVPVKDVASIIGIPVNTVKARMHRGRIQLLRMLKDAEDATLAETLGSLSSLERWAERMRMVRAREVTP